MNNNKVYFLDNEPKKDLQEGDAFGHIYYARALYEILEKTKITKSYAIGLFGILGVGKTSIINELHRLIKEGKDKKEFQSYNYKILKLDAWEYSEQNFRREFLLDLGERFNCLKEIRDKLITKRIIETKEAPKHDFEWFKKLFIQIGIFIFFWTIFLFVLRSVGSDTSQAVLCSALLLLFASTATIFRDNIKDLFTFQTTIQETETVVYPDQFKEIFKSLIQEKAGISKENDRLIIVLDNLDRLKEETVIQVLGAVKTFLKEDKCVYILPCDDDGLKQHIICMRSGTDSSKPMTESQANDYLRKFFQSTLIVRTLLTEDIDSFTDEILNKLIIFDLPIYEYREGEEDKEKKDKEIRRQNRNKVALVLRVAIAKNPRRIIQLANKLSANYLLVRERGKENKQLLVNILSNLGFLVKVNVIEEEWPEFYSLIVEYPDILRQLYNYFITENKNHIPDLLQKRLENRKDQIKDEWECGLEDFLKQTNTVYSDYVSDFLLFKQKPTMLSIANYHKFHDAALSRQEEIVESIVKNKNTNIDAAFTELLSELGTQSRNKDIPSSTSLIYCTLKIFHLITDERTQLQQRVANKISETLSSELFVNAALDVGLPELLSLLDHSERRPNKEQIIDNIVDGIKFKEELESTRFILAQLVDHYTLLTKKNRVNLRVKLTKPSQDKNLLEDFRKFANNCLATDEKLAQDLIPQEFYKQNIALLQSPGIPANDTLKFLKNFFSLFESTITEEYVDVVLQHLKQPENTMTPQKELALSCITSTPPELIPESKKKLIIERLVAYYNQLPDINHKNQVTETFLHLLPVLKSEEQQLYNPCFINTINNSNPDLLLKFTKVVQEQKKNLYELDMIVEKIRNRVQAHIANDELRMAFYELANVTESRNRIQELIISVWPQQDHALNALDEVKSVLRPKEFRSLVSTLIEKSSSLPVNQHERALEALGKHHDMYTKQFLRTLTEVLLNDWFKKTPIEARRGAKMFWQGIREKAEKERGRFHERLLEYCQQSINNDTIIEEPQKVYVETLFEDYEYLSAKSRSQLVTLCLRMIEAAKSQPIKNYGHDILRKLSKDQFAQKHVPEELLSDLEQDQNDQDIRNSFETLLLYKVYLTEPIPERLEKIFKSNNAIIQEFKKKLNKEK